MKTAGPTKKHSVIIRFALLAFAVYMVITMSSLQIELVRSKQELNDLYANINSVKLKNQELTNLLENGTESDYIERAARDRLGYVYSNEEVFTDISGK